MAYTTDDIMNYLLNHNIGPKLESVSYHTNQFDLRGKIDGIRFDLEILRLAGQCGGVGDRIGHAPTVATGWNLYDMIKAVEAKIDALQADVDQLGPPATIGTPDDLRTTSPATLFSTLYSLIGADPPLYP